MSKKINFFIHPGYGKTGTSFLQENVFDKINFINLGKPHDNKCELVNELISLQYKIFIAKETFKEFYPTNYSYLVRNYVDTLRIIINNTDKKNFILSDETLFDHNNYFGYFNKYLLKEIFELLGQYFNINIKFIITIRSQHEILPSIYAYDNCRQSSLYKSLDAFIDKALSDKNISEIYKYDLQIKKIKKIFNSEILILPLEELEQNSKNYIDRVLNFLNISDEIKFSDFQNNFINKNSKLYKNRKVYNVRFYNYRNNLFNFLLKLHIFFKKKSTFYEKNNKYFSFFKIKIPEIKNSDKFLSLNENQIKKIQKYFMQSNQNLEKNTNLNLNFYNYYN